MGLEETNNNARYTLSPMYIVCAPYSLTGNCIGSDTEETKSSEKQLKL